MIQRVVDHYRILEHLSSGGMGDVFRAVDLHLGRTVVLKFLRPELLDRQETEAVLRREAQRAAAVSHRNLAAVYELGQADDVSFLAMEYVDGESLAERLARGPLELSAALEVVRQAAEALAAIHRQGMVHCDVKTRNLMLCPDGTVKLIDFGLACGAIPIQSPPTAVGGTPSTMAPEQVRGLPVDGRTDIFALGIVLYESLTGRNPFLRETPSKTLAAIVDDDPPPLSGAGVEVPLELERILRRMLDKKMEGRYPRAEKLIHELECLRMSISGRRAAERGHAADRDSTGNSTAGELPMAQGRGFSRFGLPAAGLLMVLLAGLEIIWRHPQGAEWLVPLLLIGLASAAGVLSLLRRRGDGRLPPPVGQDSAFRGLLPFQEADRDRFYGREPEIRSLLTMLSAAEFRFGVLFGDSGCGKTSLLRAGLMPRLWEEGFVPVYSRSYADPVAALMDGCRRQSQVAPRSGEDPVEHFGRVAATMEAPLVLICDQFEEYFIHHQPGPAREPFLRFAAEMYHLNRVPVKILLAIRSDFLHLIGTELTERIPEPLLSGRLFHLRPLSEVQAEDILCRSCEGAGLPFEPGFYRMLARDLAVNRDVLPSELQIVGEQLQNRRIFTQAEYRRAGGKEALVHGYLEDVMRASGDPGGAALLLRGLISDENTRMTLPARELGRHTGLSRERTDRLLRLFVQTRLLREIQEETPWRYELIHEYLIDRINAVTGRVMDERQRAKRLLRQYMANYQVDGRSRIPLGKLWFIHHHADSNRSERERELIRKSLWRGVGRAAAAAALLFAGVAVLVAALSVQEDWVTTRFQDGHTAAVRRIVFSPDGRWLFSGAEDSTVRVWDFAHRQTRAILRDHSDWVTDVSVSPDGRYLASCGTDKKLIVRDTTSLRQIAGWTLPHPCLSVSFSPDGRYLVVVIDGGTDCETIAWSVGDWKKVFKAPVLLCGVNGGVIFWQGDNVIQATTGRLWKIPGGLMRERLGKQIGCRNFGQLSPDGSRQLNIDGVGALSLWDTGSGRLIRRFNGHQDNGRAVAWSPDGQWAASGAEDIAVWDTHSWAKLARLECKAVVWTLAYSPDSRWLVSGHGDGSILLWDAREQERVASFNEHSGPVRAVAFSPDGKRLVSSSDDRTVIIWDVARGTRQAVLLHHEFRVMSAAFTGDNRRLATSDVTGVMILWDLAHGRPAKEFRFGGEDWSPGFHMTASRDGRWIADSERVVDLACDQMVFHSKIVLMGDFYGLVFSPDSRWLLGVTHYGEIYRFQCGDWRVLEKIRERTMSLITVDVTPDGRRFVTGGDDGAIWLWEISPIHRIALLGRHTARVKALAVSPDGRWAASGGDDDTIAVWDIARRRLVTRVGVHTAPVLSLAFSPDGRRLASGEGDNSVRMHTLHRSLWGRPLD